MLLYYMFINHIIYYIIYFIIYIYIYITFFTEHLWWLLLCFWLFQVHQMLFFIDPGFDHPLKSWYIHPVYFIESMTAPKNLAQKAGICRCFTKNLVTYHFIKKETLAQAFFPVRCSKLPRLDPLKQGFHCARKNCY